MVWNNQSKIQYLHFSLKRQRHEIPAKCTSVFICSNNCPSNFSLILAEIMYLHQIQSTVQYSTLLHLPPTESTVSFKDTMIDGVGYIRWRPMGGAPSGLSLILYPPSSLAFLGGLGRSRFALVRWARFEN